MVKYKIIKSSEVKGEDDEGKPITEYIALIVQRSHPMFNEIISCFDSEIAMFNEMK